MRHLRVYTGVDGQSKRSGWEADTFSTVAAQNVIVDHCTFLWGIDENMSASGPRFTGKSVEEWRKGTSHNISRSEEHTSELQSLMRISYAVFCLKKKKEKKSERNEKEKRKN